MSHFAVMVIGQNVEEQLAPFHEFECTGFDNQYVRDEDVTDELVSKMTGDDAMSLEDALGWYGLEEKTVESEEDVDKTDTHKYGYAVVKDGQLIKAVNRTNPNKKWDWWVIGGRWSGALKLKQNYRPTENLHVTTEVGPVNDDGDLYCDQAMKSNIDLEGMRSESGIAAAIEWDKADAALRVDGTRLTWDSWETVRDVIHAGDINAAREAYHSQPAVEALHKVFNHPFYSVDKLMVDRDSFIQKARDQSTVFYALLKDGDWMAKGEMGWFGISDDKESQEDWNRKVNELIDSLSDDTLITIVDCHI